jgi:hypothetical protein
VDDLKAAMTNVRMTKQLSKVCLWADSSDFPLEKYKGCSTKGHDWSYKLNRPSRRFVLLRNGKGKIVKN